MQDSLKSRTTQIIRILAYLFGCFLVLLAAGQTLAQEAGLPPYPPQAQTVQVLFPNTLEMGTISKADPVIKYLILANEGDQLQVVMTRQSGTLMPSLALTELDEHVLDRRSANLSGNLSKLTFSINKRNWYIVQAESEKNASTGDYSLVLTGASTDIFGLLPAGLPPTASTDTPAQILLHPRTVQGAKANALYLLILQKNQHLTVTKTAGSTRMALLDAGQKALPPDPADTDTTVNYLANDALWVFLKVSQPADDKYAFAITIQENASSATLTPQIVLVDYATITPKPTALPAATSTPKPTPTDTPEPSATPAPPTIPSPDHRDVVPPGSYRLGEFQVEWYCNQQGYGIVLTNNQRDWACTRKSNNEVLFILTALDFDKICQNTYHGSEAFAILDQHKSVRAYNWSCYRFNN